MINVALIGRPLDEIPANMRVLDTREVFDTDRVSSVLRLFAHYIRDLQEYFNLWPGYPNIHAILINKASLTPTFIEALLRLGYSQGQTIHLDDASFALGVIDAETKEIEWLDHGEGIVQKVFASFGYQIKKEEV